MAVPEDLPVDEDAAMLDEVDLYLREDNQMRQQKRQVNGTSGVKVSPGNASTK